MRTDLPIECRCRHHLRLAAVACLATAVLLLLHTLGADAKAQGTDTTRTITLPAPESGVIYIRSGPPGGVRIRSRHRTPHDASERRVEPDVLSSLGDAPVAFNPADLSRLEALLARQGLDLDAGLARRGGEDVVVLRRRGDSVLTEADTLTLASATRLLQTVGGRGTRSEAAPAGVPPLITRIERSILDAGLFRSIQVNFEFDRSDLLPTAEPTLDAVANVLRRYPDLHIEIAGHSDSLGPAEYNRRLSARRAERVRVALIERGIEPERIRAEGYGESHAVLSNRTTTGRALNRRVEFVLRNPEAAERYRMEMREGPDEELERLRESIRAGIRDGFEDRSQEND